MNFNRINNIAGWAMCLFACTVYVLTSEPGGSFWDCGEFVSSCFKVQIPHPPGAPLFVLLGRIFVVLFGDDPMTAAKAVNMMSALASGFTILFLFWTITHFAVKIIQQKSPQPLTGLQQVTVIAAGIIGALAGTFTDSFWYSAVEGEVYAMSSLFTAIVFWAALKWERVADEPGADKWLVFVFLMIGLSIGVHLLCLLCVPVIVLVYYFKRRNSFNYILLRRYFIRVVIIGTLLLFIAAIVGAQSQADSARGIPVDKTMAMLLLVAGFASIGILYAIEKAARQKKEIYGGVYIFFIAGVALFGFILKAVIQYSIKGAGAFDVFFVNDLGLPFFSGFAFFFVLVVIALWWAMRFANAKNLVHLRLFLWCITFTFVGYSTYVTTLIRSNADTSIDMFNVDNPQALEGYLGREQYGDFPLIYGQTFNAQPVDYAYGKMRYSKGEKSYLPAGKSVDYVFMPEDKMIFPRMWDMGNEQGHADYYAFFAGIGKSEDGTYERSPTFMENIQYFLNYQTYFMYIRYFFWNFSGKQNDIQGMFIGNVRDGNWISGIPFIDNALYGNQSVMPESIAKSKGHNVMFMLPFVLGIIGMLYHFKKNGQDAFINFLLFLSTGFAIVIYINQSGYQPRERDYAYTGSFYAFAVWIGIAVLYFIEMALSWNRQLLKEILVNTSFVAATITLFILLAGYGGAAGITAGICIFVLIGVVAYVVPALLKYLKQQHLIVGATFILTLVVPLLMGAQEWDDHDRSKKQLARDVAKDFLESCAPNAILFTAADNDTYPLWYAQEVEGVRPDVRIVIMTLLGTDWLINSLRHKVNDSDPIDVIWSAEQTQGNKRDYIFYQSQPQFPDNRYYDLYDMMKNWVGSEDPSKKVSRGDGELYYTYPVRKLSVPVTEKVVRENGTVIPQDSVLKELRFEIPPKNVLLKSDLAILNIIAANNWKRPIYFTMPFNDLGFQQYLRKDGMAYRLVPVADPGLSTNSTYNLIMDPKRWSYGNTNLQDVYLDEINRSQLLNVRKADLELAFDLIFKNRNEEARKVLERDAKMISTENLPYGMTSRNNNHNTTSVGFLEACYRTGAKELAAKIHQSVKKDLQQQLAYYNTLDETKQENLRFEINTTNNLLQILQKLDEQYNAGTGTKALQ